MCALHNYCILEKEQFKSFKSTQNYYNNHSDNKCM